MANSIRLFLLSGAVAALGLIAAPGCSDDEETPPATGGSAGSGGTGGGTGGTAGSGGSSGSGGTGGGTGGTAGSAGTGGSAGTAGTAGAAGTAGTAGSAGTDGGTDGGDTDGGDGGGGGPTAAECTTFCTELAAACTGGNQQFANPGECQTACLAWSDDTWDCKTEHLDNAEREAAGSAGRTLHCGHAGKPGPDGGNDGPCAI